MPNLTVFNSVGLNGYFTDARKPNLKLISEPRGMNGNALLTYEG